MDKDYRVEHDLTGDIKVPADVPYGAQTVRSLHNFPLMGEKSFGEYRSLVVAMLQIKKASALTNRKIHALQSDLCDAIIKTTERLIEEYRPEFYPVHSFHGGGGISFNMNINEIIANLANKQYFGAEFGSYSPLHPNDHINFNHSTNDLMSTACHLAILAEWKLLKQELVATADAFRFLADKYSDAVKISRTCLQDAVEITFGDYFGGITAFFERNIQRLDASVQQLHSINMGATLVGRLVDVQPEFYNELIPILQQVTGRSELTRCGNLFDSCQNFDDMVTVSSQLTVFAQGIIKVAQDLRLLSSGPETGFGEITLPAIQPGSSAMPGKINPSVPEFVIQSAFQTIGRCSIPGLALAHGELDLNIWEASIITNILDSFLCMQNCCHVFHARCIKGIEVNIEKNKQNTQATIPLLTKIKLRKGYSCATRIYRESGGDKEKILRAFQELMVRQKV